MVVKDGVCPQRFDLFEVVCGGCRNDGQSRCFCKLHPVHANCRAGSIYEHRERVCCWGCRERQLQSLVQGLTNCDQGNSKRSCFFETDVFGYVELKCTFGDNNFSERSIFMVSSIPLTTILALQKCLGIGNLRSMNKSTDTIIFSEC